MNHAMQHHQTHSAIPAGLTVRSNLEGATIGVFTGERELIATLNSNQVEWLLSALTSPTGLVQLTGLIRETVFPAHHPFLKAH
ncbi:MAG: hypothetical protein PHW78_05220 [Macromonas bipunctata]|nr:hypothetical protein [Macromonas bipunctata]